VAENEPPAGSSGPCEAPPLVDPPIPAPDARGLRWGAFLAWVASGRPGAPEAELVGEADHQLGEPLRCLGVQHVPGPRHDLEPGTR
jgi:hypothetical protein